MRIFRILTRKCRETNFVFIQINNNNKNDNQLANKWSDGLPNGIGAACQNEIAHQTQIVRIWMNIHELNVFVGLFVLLLHIYI